MINLGLVDLDFYFQHVVLFGLSISIALFHAMRLSFIHTTYIPLLLTFLIYLPTLQNGIVWDDRAALLNNKDSLGERPIRDTFRHDFWGQEIGRDDSHKSYRPISVLSYRLNHYFHGVHPAGYHLLNIIIHCAVQLLVSKLAVSVFKNSTNAAIKTCVTTWLFAVHPIHTEPVSCVVGRSDLLCSFFYLSALVLYIKAETERSRTLRAVFLFGAYMLGILGSLSKEVGLMIFPVFLSVEIIRAIEGVKGVDESGVIGLFEGVKSIPQRWFVKRLLTTVLSVVIPAATILFHLSLHGSKKQYTWSILENDISLLPSRLHRTMSYAYVHGVYLWKLCYPWRLCYDYGWACVVPVQNIYDHRNVLSILCYSLVAFTAYFGLTRKCSPILWAGALTIVPFLPASNVLFPVGTIVGERLLYLPSVGFCIGVGYASEEAYRRWMGGGGGGGGGGRGGGGGVGGVKEKRSKGSKTIANNINNNNIAYNSIRRTKITQTMSALLCVMLSLKTLHRGHEWRTERSLFESALNVCPSSLKVLNNLALVLLDKENARRAGELLDRALDLHPNYPSALFNKGLVHHLFNEDALAQESFEKSLLFEVYQPKTRAYLAQTKMSIGYELQRVGEEERAKVVLSEALVQADAAIFQGCTLPLVFHVRCAVGHDLEIDTDESLQYCSKAIEQNQLRIDQGVENEQIKAENTYNAAALILNKMDRKDEAIQM